MQLALRLMIDGNYQFSRLDKGSECQLPLNKPMYLKAAEGVQAFAAKDGIATGETDCSADFTAGTGRSVGHTTRTAEPGIIVGLCDHYVVAHAFQIPPESGEEYVYQHFN